MFLRGFDEVIFEGLVRYFIDISCICFIKMCIFVFLECPDGGYMDAKMDSQDRVRKLRGGDVASFESVFREFSRELYLMAIGLVGDRQVAEDAVQECFVWLWCHREELDESYAIENYLRKSVRNYALNYFRHQRVRVDKEEDIAREQAFLHEDDGLENEDMLEKVKEIRRVVDSLPEGCRRIFVMAVVEGIGYAQTAEALGVSVNTVKSQVKIAYKKIKNQFGKDVDNETIAVLLLMSMENFF